MGVARNSQSRGEVRRVMKKRNTAHKTTKPDIGSKRKLGKFGSKQTKGHTGIAVHYVSRNKALKQLQISLKDFRRLCILKGIYPRDPPKKPVGKQSTAYYAAKDVAFLAHEPILDKFREMKAVAKKIARRLGRKEESEAKRIFLNRPKYNLDHVVRERYPTFTSCLADLDDGITLIHLFANLPISLASRDHGPKCARLAREWQLYVAKTKSLRKAFVSIKGIYYQAEVRGQAITWLVPHKFSQDVQRLQANREIDFKVMKTFLEFYETLLEFVMFKLYREDMQASYPPTLLADADDAGAFLRALRVNPLADGNPAAASKSAATTDPATIAAATSSKRQKRSGQDSAPSSLERTLAETAAKYQQVQNETARKQKLVGGQMDEEEEEDDDDDEEEEGVGEGFDDAEAKAILENERQTQFAVNLFKGMRVFLSREVPLESLEFCVESFGGTVLREDLGDDPNDASITHHITDRPLTKEKMLSTREYIQPQWLFDCINAKMLLPVAEYSPLLSSLPPHLSPFVDDEVEGYKPVRAEEIENLRKARAGGGGTEALMKATGVLKNETEEKAVDSEVEEEDSSSDDEDEAEKQLSKKKQQTEALLQDLHHENRIDEDEVHELDDEVEKEEDEDIVAVKAPEPFIPSASFRGAKSGFFFRRGPQGLGYYLDETAAQPHFNAEKDSKQNVKQQRKAEVEEAKEMRTIIMSKKAKHLYERMQYGINKKKQSAKSLEQKREAIEQQKSIVNSAKKGSSGRQ